MKRVNHSSAILNGCDDHTLHLIWRSQCNCAYWHGVFGGLYLPHLRHAIYENLILAEKQEKFNPVEIIDIDHDGVNEIILSEKEIRLFCSPIGGSIRELDYLPANFNLMNTMSRYEEHYHSKLKIDNQKKSQNDTISIHDLVISKEEGLENLLYYDSNPRWLLLDKFMENEIKINDLISGSAKECGSMVNQKYDTKIDGSKLIFCCEGRINDLNASIQKQILNNGNNIQISIEIENNDSRIIKCRYGCEFNFSFLGGHTQDRYYLIDGSKPEIPELDSSSIDTCTEFSLVTEWENIRCNLNFENDTNVWRYPVETINMSESGFEKVYQCSSILPAWEINLNPGEKFKTHITLLIQSAIATN